MEKTRKYKIWITTILFVSIFFLILLSNVEISLANADNNDLTVENLEFQFLEYSDDIGKTENISSIEIELPSSTWNVTEIELNFTNIAYYSREVKTVEDNYNKEDKFLSKGGLEGLGIQIRLNYTTTIFGVHMNIKTSDTHEFDDVNVAIRGYNPLINAPNSTKYGEVKVNHTISDGWNYQNFSTPITLHKGNYSLVMEGTIQAAAIYHWYYNDSNPNNPDLYRSENTGAGWEIGIQGAPFLYKIDQKVRKRDFYPEKFNMTAKIEGSYYKISNGTHIGSGNLKITKMEVSPNEENLQIPINNNRSRELFFDLSYQVKLKNKFVSIGFVEIYEGEDNLWTINPGIDRCNYNYSIEFEYPNNWYNLIVSKNGIDITLTEDVVINGNFLYILNDTISEGDSWEITAESPKTDFMLDVRKTEFGPDQELIFSAIAPIIDGNFTFILINALGFVQDRKMIPVVSEEIIYSYTISSNPHSGNWTAYIYWNNISDAGFQSQNFTILGASILSPGSGGGGGGGGSSSSTTDGLEPILGIIITVGIAVGAGGSLTTYQTVKSIKKKRDLHTQTLYNKFKDNLSLNYLMISDNKSGLNVYEQFFAGKSLDPSLLSGFLEAIRNFGIELTGSYQKSETVKLEYQNSKILMNERKDFRLILIMSVDPSEEFKNSITNLADEIEQKYGHLLQKFKGGEVTMFSGIKELIEKHLNVAFTYPLRIVDTTGMKLTRAEKLMVQRAKSVMKQTNLNHFFTSILYPDQQYDPEKTKSIFNLIDKGIFQPININLKKNNNNLKFK